MIEKEGVCGGQDGSMTAEAALALPLFLFFMLNLLFLVEVLRFQGRVTAALQQAGDQVREYAYYTRFAAEGGPAPEEGAAAAASPGGMGGQAASVILTQGFVRSRVAEHLGHPYMENTCLSGHLSYLGSSILTDSDRVELLASWRVRPFIPVIAWPPFRMQARYYGHAWTGYGPGGYLGGEAAGEGGSGEEVYVARTGIVYHTDPECPYLHPAMQWVDAGELGHLRAEDGEIYHPCETCHPSPEGVVLVSPHGSRYHCDPRCSAIRKEFAEVPLAEAQEHLRPCPKCGTTEEEREHDR